MSFDLNILVNGNRCKIYDHNGRKYIEAKKGSEYVIELKNNTWERILAVVAVDGLNIVDGESASNDGTGYVIDAYCSQRFYGYQYSTEKIASFKFGSFGTGYASSKGDGSEKNAGVIGVRIWDETQPRPIPQPEIHHHHHHHHNPHPCFGGLYGPGRFGYGTGNDPKLGQPTTSCRGMSSGTISADSFGEVKAMFCSEISEDNLSFDMETQWGESKNYKVKEVEFQRRSMVQGFDIYYASRESLIEMGVDTGTQKRVSFPESFKETKYAKPPKGWRGGC